MITTSMLALEFDMLLDECMCPPYTNDWQIWSEAVFSMVAFTPKSQSYNGTEKTALSNGPQRVTMNGNKAPNSGETFAVHVGLWTYGGSFHCIATTLWGTPRYVTRQPIESNSSKSQITNSVLLGDVLRAAWGRPPAVSKSCCKASTLNTFHGRRYSRPSW